MASILTICNMALAHIGDQARVTSVIPSDGSVQADLCERFYPQADAIIRTSEDWLLDAENGNAIAVQAVAISPDEPTMASIYAIAIPSAAEDDRLSTFDFAKSWLLASMLAGPIIKGDQGAAVAKQCMGNYLLWKGQALLQDARLRDQTSTYTPSAVLSRN